VNCNQQREEEGLQEIIVIKVLQGRNLSSLLPWLVLIMMNKTLQELKMMELKLQRFLKEVKSWKFIRRTKARTIRKGHQERRRKREKG